MTTEAIIPILTTHTHHPISLYTYANGKIQITTGGTNSGDYYLKIAVSASILNRNILKHVKRVEDYLDVSNVNITDLVYDDSKETITQYHKKIFALDFTTLFFSMFAPKIISNTNPQNSPNMNFTGTEYQAETILTLKRYVENFYNCESRYDLELVSVKDVENTPYATLHPIGILTKNGTIIGRIEK